MIRKSLLLLVVLLFALVGCEQRSDQEPQRESPAKYRPRYVVGVVKEATSLADFLKSYGDQQGVDVITLPQDGSLAVAKCLKQGPNCEFDAAIMASEIWLSRVDGAVLGENSQSIMQTPLVLAVRKEELNVTLADGSKLGDRQSVSALDIQYLVNQGKLKLAVPRALGSNGGFMFLVNYSLALSGKSSRVTAANLLSGNTVAAAKEFYSKVVVPGGTSAVREALATGQDGVGAAIVYEAGVISLNADNPGEFRQFYLDPVPYANYPLAEVPKPASSDGFDKTVFFKGLQEYLLSLEVQKELVRQGYRPSSLEAQNLELPSDVFNASWGVLQKAAGKPMKLPTTAVISDILNAYAEAWRKPLLLVFALDVSGSMATGGRIDKLKSAMTTILGPQNGSGAAIARQTGDKILLVAFNGGVVSTKEAKGHRADAELLPYVRELATGGGTDMYAGIVRGIDWLAANRGSGEHGMSVVVLTDGQSDGSISAVKRALKEHGLERKVTIHAVATGDADVGQMRLLAEAFSGVFVDSGDLSSLGEALKNAALEGM